MWLLPTLPFNPENTLSIRHIYHLSSIKASYQGDFILDID